MKNKGRLAVILLCAAALIMGATTAMGIGTGIGRGNIPLGLDLQGGVTILYEADHPNPSGDDMAVAESLLRRRLDNRGYTEATISREGTNQNRIRVNIPGVEDPEYAIAHIGRTAMLSFRDEAGTTLLGGGDVANARATRQESAVGISETVVQLNFTAEGGRLFEQATRNNLNRPIFIYMDDDLISAPVVNSVIIGGNAVITGGGLGGFTMDEARELATSINQGAMPFGLINVEDQTVGAQLGVYALQTSVLAGIIGILLVILSLFAVYKMAGLAANIALLMYSTIMLALVSYFQITLTLPGIAGIILSVGMAVDANVVIFERIREEIATGRTLRSAVNTGFKRALPVVIDCNLTTLIAAAALFWQGTGPVQGFAVMLALGIFVSMFSALVVTKLLLVGLVEMGLRKPSWYGAPTPRATDEEAPAPKMLPIIKFRNYYLVGSAVILLIGAASMLFHYSQGNGLFNLDVDFAGGVAIDAPIGQPFENEEIIALVQGITGATMAPQVQRIGTDHRVMIRQTGLTAEQRVEIVAVLAETYDIPLYLIESSYVSPTVSADMQRAAVFAVIFACILMLLYITFRFKDVRMGFGTIFTLLHDAFATIAIFAILRIPLSYAFIAVLLTVMGYSINATIVIYDRIRENRRLLGSKESAEKLVNLSVTQSLRRSIITTGTTLLAILAMYIIGVPAIQAFTLPIIIGLIFGTYSSVFLSGTFWYILMPKQSKK